MNNVISAVFLLFIIFGALFILPSIGQMFYFPFNEIYVLRFWRSLAAMIAGGGLALCGLVFQAMFRNPLATPYTLGIASGAAFGAALSLACAAGSYTAAGAFAGAMLAASIVFTLSQHRDASSEQMLLAGVAVNFFFSSLIVLVQYLSAPYDAFQILRWTMGGVQDASAMDSALMTPIVFILFAFLAVQSRTLNVFVSGSDRAMSLGVNVRRFRTVLFILTSLTVGGIVSVTGPIGFVGLMVPHICRLLTGPDHCRLIPLSLVFGAVFLAVCDTLGRWTFYPAELPVGIITACLGGPFFLRLLLQKKR